MDNSFLYDEVAQLRKEVARLQDIENRYVTIIDAWNRKTERNRNTIIKLLRSKGYLAAAKDVNRVEAFMDYIDNSPVDYTVFDWFRDTEENHHEDLMPW